MGVSAPALTMQGIGISFSGVQVLEDVEFQLEPGEVHGIVGANGAGKSTLMKIITGVYQPDTGTMSFYGNPFLNSFSPQEAFDQGVAMVYQDLSLVGTLTVAKNIFLSYQPCKSFGLIDEKGEIERAAELLAALGVGSIPPSTMVDRLSMGECQIVEIAKAISRNPKILILDEPTASLSNIEIEVLFQAVRELRKKGIAIIYITHYLEDIIKICDRVTILRNGKYIFTKNTGETSISEIVSGMLGRDEKRSEWTHSHRSSDAQPLLVLDKVSTRHIHDVSLVVNPGEVVGLAGLLGSGRTEILRAIYGIDSVTGGRILIKGEEQWIRSPHHAIACGISLVPEERRLQGLVLDFSIRCNMVVSILKRICSRGFLDFKKEQSISEAYIEKFQIKATGGHQIVRFLSGGNQQKVVIAKCLAANSSIILLDDPTFGIDIHSKAEIMALVRDYVTKGHGAVFVSSEFKEIASFCDRTYIVKKGKIVQELSDTALSENQLLEAVQ